MSTLADLVTQLRKDHRRHGATWWNPAIWAMAVYRVGAWGQQVQNPIVREVVSKAYGIMHLGVQLTTGIVINREAKIGSDFHLIHFGNTKIHPAVVIGEGCGIMHDVTIGTNMDRPGVPRLGNNVFVGAGAKILGGISIGDGARIAANSLVVCDVPAGATAVGVPARVLQYTGRPPSSVTSGGSDASETVGAPK
ncbi:MAG TPA: serine acetyltransferase [Polyangia bacterium]